MWVSLPIIRVFDVFSLCIYELCPGTRCHKPRVGQGQDAHFELLEGSVAAFVEETAESVPTRLRGCPFIGAMTRPLTMNHSRVVVSRKIRLSLGDD